LDALTHSAGLVRSPIGAVVFDTQLQIVWANQAAGRLGSSLPAAAWHGRRLGEVLPRLDMGVIERSLRRVLDTGEPVAHLEVSGRADGDSSEERFWSCVQFRVEGPDGEAAGVVHAMREVTEQVRNRRRLALADETSARIGTTLDITRTAEELLEVAVPRLADAGAVDVLATVIEGDRHAPPAQDQEMHFQRVALRWPADSPPPAEYLQHAWQPWFETDPATLIQHRLAAGLPVYLPAFGAMTEEQIREVASGTGLSRMLAARRAGVHSMMFVPLMARGVIMGIVILARLAGSPPFTAADLALARDFVSRAAVPLDNARLYARERATALTLQRGLLPRHIPQIPGLQLAWRYVPAETAAEVGGDWFDVIPLPAGCCALIVGDVTGHDMAAASVMGQLRTATRTLATLGLTPAQILTRLDQITAELTDAETSATCLYATCDPGGGSWDIASAGHPPPALARPGHPAIFPDLSADLPLGTGLADGPYRSIRLSVPPSSTLVFYTDGLIEDPATGIDAGMARLARALAATTHQPPTDICDKLLATLAPAPADDIAIIVVRT
jgi:hypothetical protein